MLNSPTMSSAITSSDRFNDNITKSNTMIKKTPTKRKRRLCQVEGCDRTVKSQRLCQRHGAKPRSCKVEGCVKQAQGSFLGMCKLHYKASTSSSLKEEVKSITDIDSVSSDFKNAPMHQFESASRLCQEVNQSMQLHAFNLCFPANSASHDQARTQNTQFSDIANTCGGQSYVQNAFAAAHGAHSELGVTNAERVASLFYQHPSPLVMQPQDTSNLAMVDAAETLAAMAGIHDTNNILSMALLAHILNR